MNLSEKNKNGLTSRKAKRLAEERYQAGYQAGLLVKGPIIVVSHPDKSRDYARGFADGVRERPGRK